MSRRYLFTFLLVWGCASTPNAGPEVQPESLPAAAKVPAPDSTAVGENGLSPYRQGLLTEYDIWNFLDTHPNAEAVRQTLGTPDSVWTDEEDRLQIWYYFVPEIHDYNSVEFDPATRQVTGFEWD